MTDVMLKKSCVWYYGARAAGQAIQIDAAGYTQAVCIAGVSGHHLPLRRLYLAWQSDHVLPQQFKHGQRHMALVRRFIGNLPIRIKRVRLVSDQSKASGADTILIRSRVVTVCNAVVCV